MTRKRAVKNKAAPGDPPGAGPWLARVRATLRRWLLRGALGIFGATVLLVALFAVLNPPTTPYIWSESRRLDGVAHAWVRMAEIAPVMARAAVAAEDADYCRHWGLDLSAIRAAMSDGGRRGASTISQQTVKNVYLWQGRSWLRKSIEALVTPLVEAIWSKRRILEVYLNVAEFDAGVFGVEAAAQHYFGIPARDLSPVQAARLAAVLPDPKGRSAARPSDFLRRRAAGIRDGAATIRRDGRAACFEA
ncbi:MAG: monofunctional biosynthetic peptidoglycan transglycosylase [Salibaculum sp.]|jgi:monofunctional biosynthetic peptidoglycan transglycosylase|uniref:monofunctional biosynthetic peptidoglycan transglycosylase n=1 Tax=Roseovarius halophilus (ex Wu et al. 2025) TaxID=3376060 RepID=UPI00286FEBC8|nr:monofunctional biosynthetic peptidoglycan transglycosylase [Salibaculum sp.]MDR9426755.1 monofunctional biosynthetic peptidoglycan transglycosylase [Salibaculum sp.]MDR9481311.1 monofunctional biosynthetic peptidoglycan transglycosylase [Salibaculum sp.]